MKPIQSGWAARIALFLLFFACLDAEDQVSALFDAGRYREALDLVDRGGQVLPGPEGTLRLGEMSMRTGDFERARTAYQALASGASVPPRTKLRAVCGLAELGVIRFQPDEARARLEEAGRIARDERLMDDSASACIHRIRAPLERFRERFDEAAKALDEAERLLAAAANAERLERLLLAGEKALLRLARGEYQRVPVEVEPILSTPAYANHFAAAELLRMRGWSYHAIGHYANAGADALKAQGILCESLGQRSPSCALARLLTGSAAAYLNKSGALETLTGALNSLTELFGSRHRDVAQALTNLGVVYYGKNQIPQAEENFEAALDIYRDANPKGSNQAALLANNLATTYKARGDYARARVLYERDVLPWFRERRPNDLRLATALRGYSELLTVTGDQSGAERHSREGLAIAERVGNKHEIVILRAQLGELLMRTGRTTEGIEMSKEAAALASSVGGILEGYAHAIVAEAHRGRDHRSAIRHARQALATWSGKLHPDHAEQLQIIGESHLALDEHEEARKVFTDLIAMLHEARFGLGRNAVQALGGRARALWALDRKAEAAADLRAALASEGRLLNSVLVFGSEEEKRQSAQALDNSDLYLSFAIPRQAESDPGGAKLAALAMLQRKARVTTEMRGLLEFVPKGLDQAGNRLYREWLQLLREESATATGPMQASTPGRWANLRSRRAEIERELATRSAPLRAITEEVSVERLQERIAAGGEAVVEVARFKRIVPGTAVPGPEEYAACAISKTTVQCRSLGAADAIDAAASRYVAVLKAGGAAHRVAAVNLAERLEPVIAMAPEATRFRIALSGSLNFVPLAELSEAAPAWKRAREITYLSSGRSYASGLRGTAREPGVLFAAARYRGRPAGASAARDFTGAFGPDFHRQLRALPDLPAAAREAGNARDILGLPPTRVFLDEAATEDALKAEVRGPRLLYVIAHGYSLAPKAVEGGLRWGIVLPPANRRDSDQDGVVTAREMMGLDLQGTELAMLPVCHSGDGVADGDWVDGIRRSLEVAGAQSQLLSLWRIDDEAAAVFMGHFLQKLTSPSPRLSKGEALREAQAEMRRSRKYQHPRYWAGFIVSGDPRPLRAH